MQFPVFDLHCDTAGALIGFGESAPTILRKNDLHIDLERASSLPGYAQCFACFTTYSDKISPVDIFEKTLMAFHREINRNADKISQVYSAEEIDRNLQNGMMSAILTIEGPAGFDFDPALLDDLCKIGFRMSTLGWNEKNPLVGSHITGGGLTQQGKEYLQELQRLNMLVDVSHISDEGFWDIMEITKAPVVASHSNSRAMHNISRNISDEMFKAICQTGGVVGINLYAHFLGENATIDTVCDHIIHLLNIDTECKHIALGGDLDGCDVLPKGFSGIQDYQKLACQLLERGLSEDMVYNIFWNNAMGVMQYAVQDNTQ